MTSVSVGGEDLQASVLGATVALQDMAPWHLREVRGVNPEFVIFGDSIVPK